MQTKTFLSASIALLISLTVTAQTDRQPFADIGKKVKVLTLTNGKYEEFFDDDSLQRIGSALVNIYTMKVIKLQLTYEEQRIMDNSATSRFLSLDPLSRSYPELTPYQFASNTPIQASDLDGLERLDMTNVNAQKRTAIITVVKEIQIVDNSLTSEVRALNSTTLTNIFAKGNSTVYVSSMPQNGQPVNFISQQDYNNGLGFAIDVKYDVNLTYIAAPAKPNIGIEYSTVRMGASGSNFTNNMTFAHAGTSSNTVEMNPAFDAFSTNGGVQINENYEELIAHEVGFHNMMGLSHQPNAQGVAVYPSTPTLESNVHNNIYPTLSNTQLLLQKNVTTRQSLSVIPPPPVVDTEHEAVPLDHD